MLTVLLYAGPSLALWMLTGVMLSHALKLRITGRYERALQDLIGVPVAFERHQRLLVALSGIRAWRQLQEERRIGVIWSAKVSSWAGPLRWHVRMMLWPLWMVPVMRRTDELYRGEVRA